MPKAVAGRGRKAAGQMEGLHATINRYMDFCLRVCYTILIRNRFGAKGWLRTGSNMGERIIWSGSE